MNEQSGSEEAVPTDHASADAADDGSEYEPGKLHLVLHIILHHIMHLLLHFVLHIILHS